MASSMGVARGDALIAAATEAAETQDRAALDAALAKVKLRARKIGRQKLPTRRSEFTLRMEGFG